MNKTRGTHNLKRTLSTLVVSVGVTLMTTAAPALAARNRGRADRPATYGRAAAIRRSPRFRSL